MRPLLEKVIEKGKIIVKLPTAKEAREYVMKQLSRIRELQGVS